MKCFISSIQCLGASAIVEIVKQFWDDFMNPKISVVIPVYNVENYLRECLDSIVSQTLRDIEIICVNDGSTDSSLSILIEYAKRDSRIKVLTQPNQGAGVARNTGLNIAKGDYLAILDSDDNYEQSMLEKLLKLAQKNDLDIAMCRSQSLDGKTGNISPANWTIRKEMLPGKQVFNYKDLSIYNFRFCIGWSWDKLFRRDFIERNGLRFQALKSQNDALFVFCALALADKIALLDDVLVTHRRNTGTQVSERRDKNPSCFIEAISGIKKLLEGKNRFNEVEQGFDIWCVEHTIWQLNTLALSSQIVIHNQLINMLEELNVWHRPAAYFDHRQDEQLKKKLHILESNIEKIKKLKRKIIKYKLLQCVTLGTVSVFLQRKSKYRRKLQDLLNSN